MEEIKRGEQFSHIRLLGKKPSPADEIKAVSSLTPEIIFDKDFANVLHFKESDTEFLSRLGDIFETDLRRIDDFFHFYELIDAMLTYSSALQRLLNWQCLFYKGWGEIAGRALKIIKEAKDEKGITRMIDYIDRKKRAAFRLSAQDIKRIETVHSSLKALFVHVNEQRLSIGLMNSELDKVKEELREHEKYEGTGGVGFKRFAEKHMDLAIGHFSQAKQDYGNYFRITGEQHFIGELKSFLGKAGNPLKKDVIYTHGQK